MNEKEKQDFALLINGLAETFSRNLSQAGLKIYWFALSDLTIDEIKIGVVRAARFRKFMPSAGELREMAGHETAEARALKAWSAVASCAASVGSYKSIDFEDKTVNAVIRNMGGWPALLERTGKDFDHFARDVFVRTYKSLDGFVDFATEPALVGISTDKRPPIQIKADYSIKTIPSQPAEQVEFKQELRQIVSFRKP